MASDSRSGGGRALRIVFAILAVLLLLAILLIGWLGGSESGARRAFSLLDRASGGRLHAQGVHGRLGSPLRIDKLTLNLQGRHVEIDQLRLDWHPLALTTSTVDIDTLSAARLSITGNGKPAQPSKPGLPARIGLPLSVHVDQVRIDHGEIAQNGSPPMKFAPLALSLDYDGQRYRIHLSDFKLHAPQAGGIEAGLSGEATLSATRPYPLHGNLSLQARAAPQGQTVTAEGRAALSGSLADLGVAPDFRINGAALEGRATLHPFAADKLGPAHLEVHDLDLARFRPALPATALDATLQVAADGKGTLQLHNRAAGPYDRHKLPLAAFEAAFRRYGDAIDFDRLVVQLGAEPGAAGRLEGSGSYRAPVLSLSLHATDVNLKQLDTAARATRLSGDIALRNGATGQTFSVALKEPLDARRTVALDAHGALADSVLTLDKLALQAGPGKLDASAQVALAGDRHFSAQGRFDRFRLRELGDFPKLPNLDLNGKFSLRGARAPALQADLNFDIHDSKLAGQPLAGDGNVQLAADRLQVRSLHLASGANRLSADGTLSQGASQLRFDLHAPRLEQLGADLSGALDASGTVSGSFDQPRLHAKWNAENAHLPQQLQIGSMQGEADVSIDRKQPFALGTAKAELTLHGLRHAADHVDSAALSVHFSPQPSAPLSLSLKASGIGAGALQASQLQLTADGTTAHHTLVATLDETGQAWAVRAAGGLSELKSAPRWQGELTRFQASGRFDAHLADPAPLTVSAKQLQLDHFVLDAKSGVLAVDRFSRDSDGISTRGRIERLQLAPLLQQLASAPPVRTTLQLSGDWDVRMQKALQGSVHLRRDSGDLTVLGSSPVKLGLSTLKVDATADSGRAQLQLQLDGARLGQVALNASTRLGGPDNRLAPAPDAPLDGNIHLDIPSLAWVGPLASPSLIVAGSLRGDVGLGGTLDNPRLSGGLQGKELRADLTDLGLDLQHGSLQAEFQGNQLLLRELAFRGPKGTLALSGPIGLQDGKPDAQLTLKADHYQLLDRVDRKLTLSGSSQIALQDKKASASGDFTVDSGYVDIGQANRPKLSDDVVVVGAKEKQPKQLALALDVTIGLGDGVTITGRGLDGVLVGKVRLENKADEPLQAYGTLSIKKGTFGAYGKELKIEQGEVRFNGPLDNPSLTIRAMRRGQDVAAGVAVQGSVLDPRITLVSDPEVPDAEKLSWLVLGHGLSTASTSDATTLQDAAGSLLSQGAAAGVQSRIASAVGLDTLSVGTSQDTLQQRIVTLGKQLSSRLYVSYQQGLQQANSVVQLRYILTPKLSVEAEAGARSALSLFYNISFQ